MPCLVENNWKSDLTCQQLMKVKYVILHLGLYSSSFSQVSPKKLAGQKSEGEEFADFTQLSKEISEYQQPGGGAFKVYKKPGEWI